MLNQLKTYKKHHSFEDFVSLINSDTNFQKQRIIDILNKKIGSFSNQQVIKNAIKDLSSNDGNDTKFKITTHIADEVSRISDENIARYVFHRYRYDVYPQKKLLDEYPPCLQIEPTSVCNFRCAFCYQKDASFSNKNSGFMGSMTLDLFKEIIDQCEGKIDFISLASRGEPLICKDIDEMMEYCVGKFLGLKVNTNGFLLNEKHCHAILAGGVNTLVFSIDAADELLYSQLRVNGNLDKIISNIKLFNTIKNKHYPESKIITRISGVNLNNNKQDIDSMVKLWADIADQITFVAYNPWENIYDSPKNSISIPCSDLWRRMFIWYNGEINPCDTDYKSNLTIGDVHKKTISQIWNSAEYNKLRNAHLENKRSGLNPCRRCVVI